MFHFQDVLKNTSVAVNEAAANSFIVVVQKELVPCHLYINSFLPSILRGIESRDVGKVIHTVWYIESDLSTVLNATLYCICTLFVAVNKVWMTALLESICYLTKEVIKGDVSDLTRIKLLPPYT